MTLYEIDQAILACVDMETGEVRSASIDEENRMFNVLYELFDKALTVG